MKSVPEKTWVFLKGRETGSTVKHDTIVGQMMRSKGTTEKAVDMAIRRMIRDGALLHTNIRGMYEVTSYMAGWGNQVNFKASKGKRKAKKTKTTPPVNDVIANLLDALANAETELRRLQKVEREASQLMEMLRKYG